MDGQLNIYAEQELLETVKQYLGTWIAEDGKCISEVKRRMGYFGTKNPGGAILQLRPQSEQKYLDMYEGKVAWKQPSSAEQWERRQRKFGSNNGVQTTVQIWYRVCHVYDSMAILVSILGQCDTDKIKYSRLLLNVSHYFQSTLSQCFANDKRDVSKGIRDVVEGHLSRVVCYNIRDLTYALQLRHEFFFFTYVHPMSGGSRSNSKVTGSKSPGNVNFSISSDRDGINAIRQIMKIECHRIRFYKIPNNLFVILYYLINRRQIHKIKQFRKQIEEEIGEAIHEYIARREVAGLFILQRHGFGFKMATNYQLLWFPFQTENDNFRRKPDMLTDIKSIFGNITGKLISGNTCDRSTKLKNIKPVYTYTHHAVCDESKQTLWRLQGLLVCEKVVHIQRREGRWHRCKCICTCWFICK
ncbi:hypothetical protein GQR58_026667 [Nymphon striatum]|nr:hypothetical protein GQR58_026667 [Nymphon striatum]